MAGTRWRSANAASSSARLVKRLSELIRSASARICSNVAKTAAKSLLACRRWSLIPRTPAAGCRRPHVSSPFGLLGLRSTATAVAVGITSCSSSSRFGATSTFNCVAPVILPPGRPRLPTRPSCTGSAAVVKTMGIVVIAALAGRAATLGRTGVDEPDYRHRRLLRERHQRPGGCCSAEQRDELAPFQLIELHSVPCQPGPDCSRLVEALAATRPARRRVSRVGGKKADRPPSTKAEVEDGKSVTSSAQPNCPS